MTTLNSSMTWVLRLVLAVLVVMIFATALGIVTQTQERHEAYIELQKRSRELNELKIEEQRLMIEQQTFSATPQVAQRAVSELGMFFRPMKTAVSLRRVLSLTLSQAKIASKA